MTASKELRDVVLDERFWSKVSKSDGCWTWSAGKFTSGYGCYQTESGARMSHRLSFAAHFGSVPTGMYVCHKCDNPPCVNPAHLFLGGPQDNIDDMMAKGRHKSGNGMKTHCPRGHEYTEANTKRYRGRRYYIVCLRESTRRSNAKWRAKQRKERS